MPIIGPDGRLYDLEIHATGEVRDEGGNLLQEVDLTSVVTDGDQATKILEQLEENGQ
jgi:hypothetical protein